MTYDLAEDHDRNMQDTEVRNNHNEDPSDFPLVSHDQMQTRVEHQRLPCDHTPPTDADNDAVSVSVLQDPEVEEDKSQRVKGASPRRE